MGLGASALKGSRWSYPPDEIVVMGLKAAFDEDELELTPEAEAWYRRRLEFRHQAIETQAPSLAEVSQEDTFSGSMPWWDQLREYQQEMVRYLTTVDRGINGDDRGLGKTLTTLTAAEAVGARRVLIVAPNYLKAGWRREIARWLQAEAWVALGDRPVRQKMIESFFAQSEVKYLLVNYEMLRPKVASGGYPELLAYPWDAIIYDEAHRLTGRGTQWIEGIKKMTSVPHQWFLTGNPIDAYPQDVWQLLNLIDPLKFSSYWAFVEYYCLIEDNFFGKEVVGIHPHKKAEFQYAIQPYMLHRLKRDVAPELPNQIRHDIYLEMPPRQKKFYKQIEKHMIIEHESGRLEAIEEMTSKHLRLQQSIANPKLIGGPDVSCIEDACMELVSDIFTRDDKVIVGTWFVPAADSLEEKLQKKKYEVFRVRSEQKETARDDVVEAFKACKKPAILIGTIRVMSEGLNIDECNNTIYADKAWTPLPNEQFADRTHRITSTKEKHYYHLIVEDSTSIDKEEVLARRVDTRDEIMSMRAVTERMLRRVKE